MTNTYSAFFYGSLMSRNVLLRVLCGLEATEQTKDSKYDSITSRPVLLSGYKRSCLRGEQYPGMLFTGNMHDQVTGVLCEGLDAKDINALDTFEGKDYQRIPIHVTTEDGDSVATEGYLYIGDVSLITGVEWDFHDFLTSGREQQWLNDRCEFYQVDILNQTNATLV
ncbi:hypothetical protein EDC96DRAFT_540767 [Choanephora cucurbitarum]|nr:hypothetical protein EDC96DRAFT_540767 [Choanephora cucurbitarum]